MFLFAKNNVPLESLFYLNQCQLFLQIYCVSELFGMDSLSIKPYILQGQLGPMINTYSWPRQGNPSETSWEHWQSTLRALWEEMTTKLGHWVVSTTPDWIYNSAMYKL